MNKIIPNSWEEKKFGEIGKLQGGFAFKSSKFKKKGIPIIRISNLNNGKVDLENLVYSDHVDKLNNFLIKKNDILIAMSGATTGKIGIYQSNRSAYLNQRVGRFLIQKNELLNLGFLAKIVQQDFFLKKLLVDAIGGAQPNISSNQIEDLSIKIPPLAEQKKIASILNSVDDLIEKTQSQINKLQDLKKGTINELLTKGIGHTEFKDSDLGRIPKNWQILKVLKLLEFKNGLNKEKSAFGKGNPIVNYMDVFLNPVIYSNKITGKVSLKDTEIERFKVNAGDIFFTRTSETVEEIGMSSVIIKTADKTTFSGFILRGRPITKFLYPSLSGYFFRTNYVREQIKKTCSYTTRALTNGSLLGEVVVMLPTLDEQKLIFKILDDINNLILKKNSLMKKYVLLKKSLMQDLLTGKVRVSVN